MGFSSNARFAFPDSPVRSRARGRAATLPLGWPRSGLAFLLAGLLTACSAEPTPARTTGPDDLSMDSGTGDGDGDAEEHDDSCEEGDTKDCVCKDGSGIGTMGCVSGKFGGACTDCQQPPNGSPCQPGRYAGKFEVLKYLPAAAGCFVAIWGGSGVGDLGFTLGNAPAGAEFVEVVETESCFELETTGAADGGLTAPDAGVNVSGMNPDAGATTGKSMGLEGKVDCATGEFEGIIRGVYYTPISVCGGFFGFPEPLWYPIKGKLTATYDPQSRTFKNGVIDIQEPLSPEWKSLKEAGAPIGDAFGGKGTWTGMLDPKAAAPEPVAECYDKEHYKEFELDPTVHP